MGGYKMFPMNNYVIDTESCFIASYAGKAASLSWWRHQMETFSAQLALCAGNSPVPVNSPRKGQWRGALMFSLICVWMNGWINNREAGDLRRYRGLYDDIVMILRRPEMHAISPYTEADNGSIKDSLLFMPDTSSRTGKSETRLDVEPEVRPEVLDWDWRLR